MATEAIPISRHARMTRTAISPRFAMRTFLNIRKLLIVTTSRGSLALPQPPWKDAGLIKKKPLPQEGPSIGIALFRFRLVQHNATAGLLGCFFRFLLARCHGLVAPLIGRLYIFGTCLRVFAGHVIGFATVQQVHVSHGVIVILALVNG